jgi:hypothetical protein
MEPIALERVLKTRVLSMPPAAKQLRPAENLDDSRNLHGTR